MSPEIKAKFDGLFRRPVRDDQLELLVTGAMALLIERRGVAVLSSVLEAFRQNLSKTAKQ